MMMIKVMATRIMLVDDGDLLALMSQTFLSSLH